MKKYTHTFTLTVETNDTQKRTRERMVQAILKGGKFNLEDSFGLDAAPDESAKLKCAKALVADAEEQATAAYDAARATLNQLLEISRQLN